MDSNASELSSSFSVLAIAGLFLALIRRRVTQLSAIEISTAVILLIWLAWISIQMPTFVESIPIISLVTPNRAASVFGILAILFFAYVSISISEFSSVSNSRLQLAIGVLGGLLAALLTFVGGRELSQLVTRLGNVLIFVLYSIMICLAASRSTHRSRKS